MITTTDAYKTVGCVGQNCINASFMSLSNTMDSWTDQKNKQDYKCLQYCGQISLSTTLKCDPPTSPGYVYGTPGDGHIYCIGNIDTNGTVTFSDLSRVATQHHNAYSWSEADYQSICPYSYGLKCQWLRPFTAWTNEETANEATWFCYDDNCQLATDVNGSPVLNHDCLHVCTMKNGKSTVGDTVYERSIKCCKVIEQWMEEPASNCVSAGMVQTTRRLATANSANKVLYTVSYCNVCEWTDYRGCVVCSPMSESPEDQVVSSVTGYDVRPTMCFNWYDFNGSYESSCRTHNYYNVFPWNYNCLISSCITVPSSHIYGSQPYSSYGVCFATPYSPEDSFNVATDEMALNVAVSDYNNPSNWREGTCQYNRCDNCRCHQYYYRNASWHSHVNNATAMLCQNVDVEDSSCVSYYVCCNYVCCPIEESQVDWWKDQGYCVICCDTPIYCHYDYYIQSSLNGLHLSADMKSKCATANYEAMSPADFYCCLLERGNDYYEPVLCLCPVCTCQSCLDQYLVDKCCYALLDHFSVCAYNCYCNDNGETLCKWEAESQFALFGSLGVVRRTTTLWCVDENVTEYLNYSDCIWCIYQEYV